MAKIIDKVEIDQLGVQGKFEDEVRRLNNLQTSVLGESHNKIETKKIDIRAYAKYLIQNGNVLEKRELLTLLKSRLIYKHKKLNLL